MAFQRKTHRFLQESGILFPQVNKENPGSQDKS